MPLGWESRENKSSILKFLLRTKLWAKCSHKRGVSSGPGQNYEKKPLTFYTFTSLKEIVPVIPSFLHPLFSSHEGMTVKRFSLARVFRLSWWLFEPDFTCIK